MKRNQCMTMFAALLALLIMAGGSANATVVIYEPFSQDVGGLNGVAGGTGLGNWTAASQFNIASPTLSYGILPNAGNQVNVPAVLPNASASVNSGALTGLLDNGDTLWFSVVTTGASGSNQHSGFALGNAVLAPSFDGARLNGDAVGFYTRNGNVQAATWSPGGNLLPDSLSGTLSSPQSQTNLIVGKIEWGATAGDVETITLFTPDLADLLLPATSVSTTIAGFDQSTLNIVSFASRNGPQSFDEIRFGETFEDVIGVIDDPAVPEPTTAALGLMGVVGLLGRRRRTA